MPQTQADFNYLTKIFNAYYNHDDHKQFLKHLYISDLEMREFGITPWLWEFKGFSRHLGFPRLELLLDYITTKIPQHFFASAARYERPDYEHMNEKGYVNCDLIFDIDVDHIDTPCKMVHDRWLCPTCKQGGVGMPPTVHSCGGKEFIQQSWECESCLEVAKQQMLYLIEEFLLQDFGLTPDDLYITFSGRRGYHIHVENKAMIQVDSAGRRDIVDYIVGTGLEAPVHEISVRGVNKPKATDKGWRGRIVRLLIRLIQESDPYELQAYLRTQNNIEQVRNDLLDMLSAANPTWQFRGIGTRTWRQLIDRAIQKYAPQIDRPVTIDTHRLIRLPGSLHGKTGFLVKKLSLAEFKVFDPFKGALVFLGERQVYVQSSPEFRIGEETFGPYTTQVVELPMSAAIFLLARGAASIKAP